MHALDRLDCDKGGHGIVNFKGVVSGCPLFRGSFALKSHVGSLDLVRCPESRSVRFSEVANVLYNYAKFNR